MTTRREEEENLKIVKEMLMDFFKDSTHHFKGKSDAEISLRDLRMFIESWCEKHFK